MLKIAITGKAASGKNTTAKIITDLICSEAQKSICLAFADPIKEIALTMFPQLPKKYLYGSSKYRSKIVSGAFRNGEPLTVRQLLIDIGTAGRSYNPDVWIDVLHHRLKEAQKENKDLVVVMDVRFRNEYEFLKKMEFYQIKLYRDAHTVIDHISETEQDALQDSQFNCILHNNGALYDLRRDIRQIVELLPNL